MDSATLSALLPPFLFEIHYGLGFGYKLITLRTQWLPLKTFQTELGRQTQMAKKQAKNTSQYIKSSKYI